MQTLHRGLMAEADKRIEDLECEFRIACDKATENAILGMDAVKRVERAKAELASVRKDAETAINIGLAFIGAMFPDSPVTDDYAKRTEASLRALREKPND